LLLVFSCLAAAWIIAYLIGISETFAQSILEDFISWGETPISIFVNAICNAQVAAYTLMQIEKIGATTALGVGCFIAG